MKNKLFLIIVFICSVLFSLNVYTDESLAEQIIGEWYICYPGFESVYAYQFGDNGIVIEKCIDQNGTEEYAHERFTYEVKENIIAFDSIGMDGSTDHYYAIDTGEYAIEFVEENLHLVYMGDSEYDVEWSLYPTKELAIENSDTYENTDGYVSDITDADEVLNVNTDDEIRRNSLLMIILSAICIVAVVAYIVIRTKVKRGKSTAK